MYIVRGVTPARRVCVCVGVGICVGRVERKRTRPRDLWEARFAPPTPTSGYDDYDDDDDDA